jgi:hypothetical protein
MEEAHRGIDSDPEQKKLYDEAIAANARSFFEAASRVKGGYIQGTTKGGDGQTGEPATFEQNISELVHKYLTPALGGLIGAALTEFLTGVGKESISRASKKVADELFGGDDSEGQSKEPRPSIGKDGEPEICGDVGGSAEFTAEERRKLRRLLRVLQDDDLEH